MFVFRSTIKGVKVDLERNVQGTVTGVDMRLVHDGKLIGDNRISDGTSPLMWPPINNMFSWGGPTDLW